MRTLWTIVGAVVWLGYAGCADEGGTAGPSDAALQADVRGAGGQGGQGGQGGNPPPPCADLDRDGYQDRRCNNNPQRMGGDCDDQNDLVYPGREENCANMIDNDCNGRTPDRDPACGQCPDLDQDGFQDAACNADRANGADCDDMDPAVNPGTMERCGNFKDDDCSGGDVPCLMNCEDRDLDGFGSGSGCRGPDCDDTTAQANPWQSEICGDNFDQDCNGEDLECPEDCVDQDKDGFGEGAGCINIDCDDADPTVNPGARERPGDGIDQDCDGSDLVLDPNCRDLDQDGYGEGGGCRGEDCDDGDPRVHRGRTEICGNGVDDDCAGGDRPCVRMGTGECMDMDGDGFGPGACPKGTLDCNDNDPNINPDAEEVCNEVDDNCNEEVDECARRNQVCEGDRCVGAAGSPCREAGECGFGLTCNFDLRECRVRDGEPCEDSAECNPTAECIELDVCYPDQRCYQAKGGPCESDCDCTGEWLCQDDNSVCVECIDDGQCDGVQDTCSTGGFCAELTSIGGAGNDARVQFVQRVVACWAAWAESNEAHGCDILVTEAPFEIRGMPAADIPDADTLEDYACDGDALSQDGFDEDDQDIIREVFGCGVFDIWNIWLMDPVRPGQAGETCIYYAPAKPGFGFPDNTRPAVVVDSCALSSFTEE